MPKSLLQDAFDHHTWANLRLIDVCMTLTPAQLAQPVPGTYGSILDMMRHIASADTFYIFLSSPERAFRIEKGQMGLPEVRATMERIGAVWSDVLADDPDPDALLHEVDEEEGLEQDSATGVVLAQAIHHGTDHRSQVCTALTALGIEPPEIDAWAYGLATGRVIPKRRPS